MFWCAVPHLFVVPFNWSLSHWGDRSTSVPLFVFSSIDEELAVITLQKIEEPHYSSMDEELIIVMFQKLKNSTTLQLSSISFRSLFNWRGTTWHRSTLIPWCLLKFIVRLVKCVIYYFDFFRYFKIIFFFIKILNIIYIFIFIK